MGLILFLLLFVGIAIVLSLLVLRAFEPKIRNTKYETAWKAVIFTVSLIVIGVVIFSIVLSSIAFQR